MPLIYLPGHPGLSTYFFDSVPRLLMKQILLVPCQHGFFILIFTITFTSYVLIHAHEKVQGVEVEVGRGPRPLPSQGKSAEAEFEFEDVRDLNGLIGDTWHVTK
jgi:hypothetical protein